MKSHSKGEKPTVSAAANKNHEKYEKMLRTALAEARFSLAKELLLGKGHTSPGAGRRPFGARRN